MITISDTVEGILAGYSYTLHSRLQAWLGGDCIAEDIPAVDVQEELDESLRVPERLTFKVPIEVDAVSWVPTEYDSPLGIWGQRIVAQVGIGVGSTIEWLTRGTFLTNSAETGADSITVEALGLLQLVDEAVLATEYQPKAAATLKSIVRALIEPGVTALFSGSLTDRTAPTGVTWSDNRLDDLYEVLNAWPARAVIHQDGYLNVEPALTDPTLGDEVFSFTDGENGTAVEFSTSISREGAFNAVVAKGQQPDTAGADAGQEIVATAYDTDPDSPFRQGGFFSPFMVPYGYASPLLTTRTQVTSAANTRLTSLRRDKSKTVHVTAVPHPALQTGDPVTVTSARLGITEAIGRIGALTLPHQAEGGSMSVTVRLVD